MTNSDFWKSQFIKHHAVPGPQHAAGSPRPHKIRSPHCHEAGFHQGDAVSLKHGRNASVSRSTQSKLSFEKFVSLVLLKFPAKARAQWEQWLLNQKASLVKKWNLSE